MEVAAIPRCWSPEAIETDDLLSIFHSLRQQLLPLRTLPRPHEHHPLWAKKWVHRNDTNNHFLAYIQHPK